MAYPVRLPGHDHCGYCGNAVQEGVGFCSDECMRKKQEADRKEKMTEYGFLLIAILTVAIPAAFIFLK
jgi:predicted nucleic acid-binding Zn ribbon protein